MKINFWKGLIYALTFIGFAHSGFISSILNNLRDVVLSSQSVFGDVLQNVVNIANKFKNLDEIFNAAVDENCVFKCPVKDIVPTPNRNHVPTADGCGSLGLKIKSDYLPIGEMTKCCDSHDICYDTCNRDKETCDVELKRCLYQYCDNNIKFVGDNFVKACKATAKLLFTGTLTLGCKSYLNAQKKACYCPNYGWKDSRNSKYAKGSGEL